MQSEKSKVTQVCKPKGMKLVTISPFFICVKEVTDIFANILGIHRKRKHLT